MQRRILLLAVVVAVGFSIGVQGVPAQPRQGDLVVTRYSPYGGIFYAEWPNSVLQTLHAGWNLDAVKMCWGNEYVHAVSRDTGYVYKYTVSGTWTTVCKSLPLSAAAMALDQDGTYLVAIPNDYRLYRMSATGGVSVWLTLSGTKPNAICRDGNTGDWIVGTTSGIGVGQLLRIDRTSKSIATLSTSIGSVYGVDWIPQTGEYVVACTRAVRSYVSWVRSDGSIRTSSTSASNPDCVKADQRTGRVFVGGSSGDTGIVYEFTYSGTYVRGRSYGNGRISSIDVWQHQNVSVATWNTPQRVLARLKFPRSPNRPYYVALSFACRPGFQFSTNNWANLTLDTLFLVTFGGNLPYFTSAFSGKLNNVGYANAGFVMPYSGSRVYVSAVAVNPVFVDNLDIGNVEVVDTW